jgi:hypothetical protein
MKDLTELEQRKVLTVIAEMADEQELAIAKNIVRLDDKIDSTKSSIDNELKIVASIANEAKIIARETSKQEGPKGEDGKDYILTEQDKLQIASKVKVPSIEKTIEKTVEIIKEVPFVDEAKIATEASRLAQEAIKSQILVLPVMEQELPKHGTAIRDGLELLTGADRLSAKAIKDLPEQVKQQAMLHTPALSILPDVSVVGVTMGQTIKWDGTKWVNSNDLAGSPAGSNTQIQYNDNGVFGADANFLRMSGNATTMSGIKLTDNFSATNGIGINLRATNDLGTHVTGLQIVAYQAYYSYTSTGIAVTADGSSSNYGITTNATGSGSSNYGIYATASGGTTNYAGYFVGNTYMGGTEKIYLSNNDYTNTDGAGSHIIMDNPDASGQNVVSSIINGSVVAKWRTDYVGNISWVAGTSGVHDFYTGGDFGVGTSKMTIQNGGTVSIYGNLDIGGQIHFTGGSYATGVLQVGGFAISTDINTPNSGSPDTGAHGASVYLDTRGTYGIYTVYHYDIGTGYESFPLQVTQVDTVNIGSFVQTASDAVLFVGGGGLATGKVTSIIQAEDSQTEDLMQFKDYGGGTLAHVGSDGSIQSPTFIGGSYTGTSSIITGGNINVVVSTVRGSGATVANSIQSITCRPAINFTVTLAAPGVCTTATPHGLVANDLVKLTTTGALPTGLSTTGFFYVRNPASTTFELSLTSGGASITTSGSQSGTHTVTMDTKVTFASAHGRTANDTIFFAGGTPLPTGITAGTTYYVGTQGLTTTVLYFKSTILEANYAYISTTTAGSGAPYIYGQRANPFEITNSYQTSMVTVDQYGNLMTNKTNTAIRLGIIPTDSNYSGIWFASAAVSPSSSNYSFLGDVSNTFLNGPTNVFIRTANTTRMTITSGTITIADATNIAFNATTGSKLGTATTDKIAFHNSTPVAQRAGAAQAAVSTTGSTNITPYGFTTSAQADAIVTLVNELRAALVEKGIIKGSS